MLDTCNESSGVFYIICFLSYFCSYTIKCLEQMRREGQEDLWHGAIPLGGKLILLLPC